MTPPGDHFATLRLAAAALVIAGHSYALLGAAPPTLLGVPIHILGLHVFFTVSGYLVTGSWRHDPSLPRYAARRALRIMPALVVLTATTTLLLGPLTTTLPIRSYTTDPETWRYLWNAALAPFYTLPGVFQDERPIPVVNGSLWSLPIEATLYVLLPLVAGRSTPARAALFAATLVAAATQFTFTELRPDQVQPVIWWNSIPFGLRYAGDFTIGAALRAWSFRLPAWTPLILLACAPLPPRPPPALLVQLALPLAILAIASLPGQSRLGRRADLSYGLYLYGFPAQQLLLPLAPAPLALAAVSLAAATLPAALSWFLVEAPCLRLKPRSGLGSALSPVGGPAPSL